MKSGLVHVMENAINNKKNLKGCAYADA